VRPGHRRARHRLGGVGRSGCPRLAELAGAGGPRRGRRDRDRCVRPGREVRPGRLSPGSAERSELARAAGRAGHPRPACCRCWRWTSGDRDGRAGRPGRHGLTLAAGPAPRLGSAHRSGLANRRLPWPVLGDGSDLPHPRSRRPVWGPRPAPPRWSTRRAGVGLGRPAGGRRPEGRCAGLRDVLGPPAGRRPGGSRSGPVRATCGRLARTVAAAPPRVAPRRHRCWSPAGTGGYRRGSARYPGRAAASRRCTRGCGWCCVFAGGGRPRPGSHRGWSPELHRGWVPR